MSDPRCEDCCFNAYDEENEEYYCSADFDQDEAYRFRRKDTGGCPYFRSADPYSIAKKQ